MQHINSFYFDITIDEKKSGYTITNNRTGKAAKISRKSYDFGRAASILHMIRGAYKFYGATLRPEAPEVARQAVRELTEVCDVLGVTNSSYDSLLREAIGPLR